MENEEAVPLLIAAGGGGKAYLEDPESSLEQMFLEQYENEMTAAGVNGKTGAAGLFQAHLITMFIKIIEYINSKNCPIFCFYCFNACASIKKTHTEAENVQTL